MFTSITNKGNAATSLLSQDDADSKARAMDQSGCENCTDCTDCRGCKYCTSCRGCTDCKYCEECRNCMYCRNCRGCRGCEGCTGCKYCTSCRGCTDCMYCGGCRDCTDCTDCTECTDCTGCTDCICTVGWDGGTVSRLLCINATPWPISISSTHAQVGCVNERHEWWIEASDEEIARRATVYPGTVAIYRGKYGPVILAGILSMSTLTKEPVHVE